MTGREFMQYIFKIKMHKTKVELHSTPPDKIHVTVVFITIILKSVKCNIYNIHTQTTSPPNNKRLIIIL